MTFIKITSDIPDLVCFCPPVPISWAQELQLVCSLLYSQCLEQHLAHADVGINFLGLNSIMMILCTLLYSGVRHSY